MQFAAKMFTIKSDMSNQNQGQNAAINSVRALLNGYAASKSLQSITAQVEAIISDEGAG